MFYVYENSTETGKKRFCSAFNTVEAAITYLYTCYDFNNKTNVLGKYYYFIRQN